MSMHITILAGSALFREGLGQMLTNGGHAVACFSEELFWGHLATIPDHYDQLLLVEPVTADAGIALCQRIRTSHCKAPILLMCEHISSALRGEAIRKAVNGLVFKQASYRPFINALEDLMQGKNAPRGLYDDPASERRMQNFASLTPREREIVGHLVRGQSNKVIARELDITEATVKVHLKMLLRKLGVENRTQAALYAVRCAAVGSFNGWPG